MEQRSNEWHDARLGRFTASKISLLLGKDGLVKTKQAIDNYAVKAASEMYFGLIESDYVSFDMQRGLDLEPIAFEKFKELKGLEFLDVSKCGFIPYGKHGGASPDGIISNGRNLEMKCPTIENFAKLVLTNEIKDEYMEQMQMQMLCLDTDLSYFFNYVVHMGKEYWHTIEVSRNEATISLIKERLEMAGEKKMKYYDTLSSSFGGAGYISFFDEEVNSIITQKL